MYNINICNCVNDTIKISLNGNSDEVEIEPCQIKPSIKALTLPMHSYPIIDSGIKINNFSKTMTNRIIIHFDTIQTVPIAYDIEIDKEAYDRDLYFYIFKNTLVAQDQKGYSEGISVYLHKTVLKIVQDGHTDSLDVKDDETK
jgi:hypothetical protein